MSNLMRAGIAVVIALFMVVLVNYAFGDLMITMYEWATYYTVGTNLAGVPGNVLTFYNLFFQFFVMFLIVYIPIVMLKRQDDRWRPL